MRRLLRALLFVAPFALTLGTLGWFLTQTPWAQPMVEKSAEAIRRDLSAALARAVTPEWLAAEMATALAAEDLDRALFLTELAARQEIAVPETLAAGVAALEAAETGMLRTAGDCGRCMIDIGQCERLSLIAACGVPFELSPAGDVNALRRAGVAWWSEEEIDRLDAGLAVVGLAATGAVLASGGTSATVKAGAGMLRAARRLGTLTPDFARVLGDLARVDLKPGRIAPYFLGRASLDEVADMGKVAALGAVASDLGRVAARTSLTDAVVLMRHVDSAEDAARLARVSDAMGPSTRAGFDVLGKGRVFRGLVRLSDLALATLAAVYALALQLLVAAADAMGRAMLRLGRRYA